VTSEVKYFDTEQVIAYIYQYLSNQLNEIQKEQIDEILSELL